MEGGIPILKRVGLNYFAPFITQSTFLLFLARAVSRPCESHSLRAKYGIVVQI